MIHRKIKCSMFYISFPLNVLVFWCTEGIWSKAFLFHHKSDSSEVLNQRNNLEVSIHVFTYFSPDL